MRYKSKPVEVEAEQWVVDAAVESGRERARQIVDWVNANGGEARYHAEGEGTRGRHMKEPRIAVRTVNGWAIAAPGHYVVKGEARLTDWSKLESERRMLIDFYPCDQETFERRWEPA